MKTQKASARRRAAAGGAVLLAAFAASATPAFSEDFFTRLFSGFSRPAPPPPSQMRAFGYASEGDEQRSDPFSPQASPPVRSYRRSTAYCVRTCDGRYFPAPPVSSRSNKTEACNSLCPSSETQVFYGSSIDNAVSKSGKSYSNLPNAFRYRNEIVSACTCNGRSSGGLARVDLNEDATVRNGDIVATVDGLMVAKRKGRRHAQLNFSPAPASIVAKYQRPARIKPQTVAEN